jgi:hypothetical protein
MWRVRCPQVGYPAARDAWSGRAVRFPFEERNQSADRRFSLRRLLNSRSSSSAFPIARPLKWHRKRFEQRRTRSGGKWYDAIRQEESFIGIVGHQHHHRFARFLPDAGDLVLQRGSRTSASSALSGSSSSRMWGSSASVRATETRWRKASPKSSRWHSVSSRPRDAPSRICLSVCLRRRKVVSCSSTSGNNLSPPQRANVFHTP